MSTCSISNKNTTDFTIDDDLTRISRCGKAVTLVILCNNKSAFNTWTDKTVFYVSPAPKNTTFGVLRGNDGATMCVQIEANGAVKIRTLSLAIANNSSIRGSVSYICD